MCTHKNECRLWNEFKPPSPPISIYTCSVNAWHRWSKNYFCGNNVIFINENGWMAKTGWINECINMTDAAYDLQTSSADSNLICMRCMWKDGYVNNSCSAGMRDVMWCGVLETYTCHVTYVHKIHLHLFYLKYVFTPYLRLNEGIYATCIPFALTLNLK